MSVTGRLPLSVAQQGVWLAHQLDGSGRVYNCAEYLDIAGPVDVGTLTEAWRRLCAESEALRVTTMDAEGQVVADTGPPLSQVDLRGAADPHGTALELMHADAESATDLATGPLSAALLLRIADDRFLCYFRVHHAVIDGYGMRLLQQRLAELYGDGDAAEPPGRYRKLIEEDARYRASPEFAADRAYWAERFGDRPAAMRVGRDRQTRWNRDVPVRHRSSAALSRETVEGLRTAAGELGATWQVLFLAVSAAYVYRLTGRTDVILGLPVTGRRSMAARRTPGMLTNTVPLRVRAGGSATLHDLVRSLGTEVQKALRHERYRLEDFHRDLDPGGSAGGLLGPLVNFMPWEAGLSFGPHRATSHNIASGPVVDFTVTVRGDGSGGDVALIFEANPSLHEAGELEVLSARMLRLLDAVAADPARTLARYDLLSAEERDDLTHGRNATAAEVPAEPLERQIAGRAPERVAVRCGDRELTYAHLNSRADALAARLAARGVGPEDLVAVFMPRAPELVVALLGVLRAGAGYVPVDPAYPADRVRWLLDDLAPSVVVTTRAAAAAVPAGADVVLVDDDQPAGDPPRSAALPEHPAYVVYTSGSTGTPKGVVVTRAGLGNLVADHRRRFAVTPDSRILQFASPSFDVAACDIWPTLAAGATLVLIPHGYVVSPDSLVVLLREGCITHATLPPVLLKEVRDCGPAELPDLRVVITGGEHTDQGTIARWAGGRRMVNVYGVTEATVATTATAPLTGAQPSGIGRPVSNCRVHILDRDGRLAVPGAVGELFLAGAGLARGYLRRPAMTADRFVPDPYGPPGTRMYRSGDLARWRSDGTLEYVGRVDEQVKVNGYRVEPAEVEAVLSRHDAVVNTVVVLNRTRSGDGVLAAYVQPAPDSAVTPAELRAHAAAQLPAHLVPAVVVLVPEMRLTASGKVDRRALPAVEVEQDTEYAAPTSATEALLCDLVAEVLGRDRVGVHDSFFAAGGDSLGVVRLVSRARAAGLELTAAQVFDRPTVAELAQIAAAAGQAGAGDTPAPTVELPASQLEALARQHPGAPEVLPLSPLQEGLLFHTLAAGPADAYVAQLAVDLAGPLDPARLHAAATALLRRHPNLRAAFHYADVDVPVQVFCEDVTLPWRDVNLSDTPNAGERAERLAEAERDARFDPAAAPLVRMLLVRLPGDRHRLLLTAHHILWDGWSTTILLRELFQLYAGTVLPPVVPFARYLGWLGAQDRDASRAAWSAALADLGKPTLVAPPGGEATAVHGTLDAELDAAATAELTAFSAATGITAGTVVQVAWAQVLSQLTGQDDVVFGCSVSGRPPELPGVESVVGLLTNTVPVRVTLRPGEDGTGLLRRVQAENARLLPHHYLSLSDIQRQAGLGTLFDTAVGIVGESFDGVAAVPGAPRVRGVSVADGTHYPLRLAVRPGECLGIRLGHRLDVFTSRDAARLLDRFRAVLTALTAAAG